MRSGPADVLQSKPNSAFSTSERDIKVQWKLFRLSLKKSVMEAVLCLWLAWCVDGVANPTLTKSLLKVSTIFYLPLTSPCGIVGVEHHLKKI